MPQDLYKLPKGWEWKPFPEVISTKGFSVGKVKTKEYGTEGNLPIIDQSKSFIAGYCNSKEGFKGALVMSTLTRRYSASPESQFDFDIRRIDEVGVAKYLQDIESAELSDGFWLAGLPQQLNTSVASSPYFNVYLAAQVKMNDKGFLSRDITVGDLISYRGDVHHLFPKNYLKSNGLPRGRYNQIANYVMMQSEINIAIKDRAPSAYFSELLEHCGNGQAAYGAITDLQEMQDNFRQHCIPDGMEDKTVEHFDDFLEQRRQLMALKIKDYYSML